MNLEGRCNACAEVKPARQLNLVFAPRSSGNRGINNREWEGDGNFALVCDPCLVDGLQLDVA